MKHILYIVFALMVLLVGCSTPEPDDTSHWLVGSWVAPAFDGELHETWEQSSSAMFMKEGYYIEGNDTLYSEQVKIDSLFSDVYLLAQPKGGNPVIFRLSNRTDRTMTFKNQGNWNPFKILYERVDDDHFVRTTYGVEQGDTVSNRFEFLRTTQ